MQIVSELETRKPIIRYCSFLKYRLLDSLNIVAYWPNGSFRYFGDYKGS